MHYYQHHIGDFIKVTARLSDSQCMAYLRLIWRYYDTEGPLNPDIKIIAFQIGTSIEETELLLKSFFWLAEDGWHHTRCDKEIAEYHEMLNKRSNAGKASAERKKNTRSTRVEQVLNEDATSVQLTSNQEPVTNRERSPSGSRLTATELDPEWKKFCLSERPELDPALVFDNFCNYWKALPGAKGNKTDWFLTWKNWVRRETAIPANKAKEVINLRRGL